MSEFAKEPEEKKIDETPATILAAPEATATADVSAIEKKDEVVSEVADAFEQSVSVIGAKSDVDSLREIQARRSHLSAGILFTDPILKIPNPILEALTIDMRFERPSAVQATTIPYIQDGMNVIAQAQAGSGKTISFTIGMLSRIDPNIQAVQALCLTPTRDLAQQIINDAVVRLACRMPGVKVEPALPGYNQDLLPVKSHIVVGTPGKVKDWITRGVLNVSQVKVFVLDEADEMVKQGAKTLAAETIAIKNKLPSSCQILLFSATYPPQVLTYAQRIVDNAVTVKLASDQELILSELFQVNMDVNKVSTGGKLQILRDIYDFMTVSQSIIFVETKVEAQSVSKLMNDMGFGVSVLTGDLEGAVRDQTLQDFRDGKSKVLITTNVLARGVDIPAVAVVVNYDVPGSKAPSGKFFEDACSVYVHRIGRCSRFGRRGVAINLLQTEQDFATMSAIENHYSPGKRMTKDWDPRNIEELRDFIENRSAAEAEA